MKVSVPRDFSMYFGAREAKDLYALEQIESIRRRWKGSFRFVPVLSSAEGDASWKGERGLVADEIPGFLETGSHAYLCGPPAMIDAAVEALRKHGVARHLIHFDRFTTLADAPLAVDAVLPPSTETASTSSIVGVLHYLKYFLFHAIGLVAVASLLAGGELITAGLIGVLGFYMIGDAISGDDTTTPKLQHRGILTAQL